MSMECKTCESLFDVLAAATMAHIRQHGQLEIARLQRDQQAEQVLREFVDKLKAQREQALTSYRTHVKLHEVGQPTTLDHGFASSSPASTMLLGTQDSRVWKDPAVSNLADAPVHS